MRRSHHHRLRAALLAGLAVFTATAMTQPAQPGRGHTVNVNA